LPYFQFFNFAICQRCVLQFSTNLLVVTGNLVSCSTLQKIIYTYIFISTKKWYIMIWYYIIDIIYSSVCIEAAMVRLIWVCSSFPGYIYHDSGSHLHSNWGCTSIWCLWIPLRYFNGLDWNGLASCNCADSLLCSTSIILPTNAYQQQSNFFLIFFLNF
jgi:hypothetical protein